MKAIANLKLYLSNTSHTKNYHSEENIKNVSALTMLKSFFLICGQKQFCRTIDITFIHRVTFKPGGENIRLFRCSYCYVNVQKKIL